MYKCAQYTRMYMCLKVAPEGAFITVYITVASDKNILYFIDSIRGIATLLKIHQAQDQTSRLTENG